MNPIPYYNSFSGSMNPALPHESFAGFFVIIMIAFLLAAWSLVWKGLALWRSAKLRQTVWFVVFLIVNTFGILEILYLIVFRADKEEVAFKDLFSTHWRPKIKFWKRNKKDSAEAAHIVEAAPSESVATPSATESQEG